MKQRIRISLIALTCFGMLYPAVTQAQSPLDKFIPKGTLLKKLKREIIGESSKAKAKVPTLADLAPQRAAVPTKAIGKTNGKATGKQPTLATRPLPPVNRALQSAPRRHSANPAVARNIQPSTLNAAMGFGLILQIARNNDLVVTRLQPQGNAGKAGLKPGDVIKTVGSVEIESIEEYDQITKGMKAGDHMEFEYVRRGKPGKALIPFGQLSKNQQVAVTSGQTEISSAQLAANGIPISSTVRDAPSVLDESMDHPIRVSRLPQSAASVVTQRTAVERRLNRTIEDQQVRMQRMEQELEMLRRTTTPAIAPVENRWALPDLGSPN